MSLRVWLPLNGTLENKGLDNVTPTLTGVVAVDNNGKIGKCYKFGTATGRITIPSSTMTSFSECSVAFWVYILGWQTNWDTFFQAGLGTTPWNSYTFGVLRNSSNCVVFAISDGSTSSQGNYKSSDLTLNTWYHLTFTYKAGHCCIYVNGVLFKDYATTIVPNFSNITYVSIGQLGNAASYQTNCKMNDVRIYDHALSPLEVKQISQGLILHYPLNRNGWGQENLLKNSNFLQGTNGFEGYAALNATCAKQTDCMKVVSTSASGGFYTSNFNNITTGDMTTFSADVKANSNMTIYIGTDGSGNGNCQAYTVGTSWQRISISKAKTTNNANLRIYGNGTFYAKNLKYELGSIATPWCPNSSDALATTVGLNDNIEYDTSGYGNNGTKINALTYLSDTPKYNISTHFGATNQKIHIENLITTGFSNSYSFSWWGKRTSNDPMFWGFSDGVRLNGMYLGTFWNTGDSSSNPIYQPNTTTIITASSLNIWHHYVMTGDGTTCKLYLDGELYGQAKTYKSITGTSIYINGWDSGTSYSHDNMDMSDFRIYATALSAEDVKSLYNNSAYIDNQGNIYGAVNEHSPIPEESDIVDIGRVDYMTLLE